MKRGEEQRKFLIFMEVLLIATFLFVDAAIVLGSGSFSLTGSMSVARRDHTATLLPDGKVLIVGYIGTSAEIYDPSTGTFNITGNTVLPHGQGSSATRLTDGRVLVVGGTFAQTTAEIYDPTTGTFALTGPLNTVHSYHTATLLPDGRVLIAGGQDNNGPQTHNVAELYDPTTGLFTLTGSLNYHRSGHTATLLQNGKVLITGGTQTTTPGEGIALDSAEIYDPFTGTFSLISSMATPRTCHRATLLSDGRVLIVGGLIFDLEEILGSAEIFDPSSETFSATEAMTTLRASSSATLLPNGQVLIAGGCVDVGPITTNSAELFDPISGTFTPTGDMIQARQQHTATMLSTGQVLVVGGYGDGTDLSSAELYKFIPTPNLTPFMPGGWSDKIVVTKNYGETTDSTPFYSTDFLYAGWAVVNNGDASTVDSFTVHLYLDGELNTSYSIPPRNPGEYGFDKVCELGNLSPGIHSIRVVADLNGEISESNELDNEYVKTITVIESRLPGDCNGDGRTSIDEVQRAINQFLGISSAQPCNDLNGDGQVTIDEVQIVINAFLGITS
jgi:hypothetical protein